MNNRKEPYIVRRVSKTVSDEVEAVMLDRELVVYVVSGEMKILYNGFKTVVDAGKVVLINRGFHQFEYSDCEMVVFQLFPPDIEQFVLHLSTNVSVHSDHSCEACRFRNFFVANTGVVLREFFASVYRLTAMNDFKEYNKRLKLEELIYLILSGDDICLKTRLIRVINCCNGDFSKAVYSHIFNPTSISDMANQCSLSVTAFKREFQRRFHTSPHKWATSQRLNRAKILLLTSNRSVSEIADICAFSDISHFSKCFKQRYSLSPSLYRKKFKGN